jgi:hypothetical protein
MQELVVRGNATAALDQYPNLSAELKRTPEVCELYLAAHLERVGFSYIAVVARLGPLLADPLTIFQRLPADGLPNDQLRALVEIALANPEAARQRETYYLLSGATALLGSLSLCKASAEDGPALFLQACEYVAADSAVDRGPFASAARTLLDRLDVDGESRAEAVERMLGVVE